MGWSTLFATDPNWLPLPVCHCYVGPYVYWVTFLIKLTDVFRTRISSPGILAITAYFREPSFWINFWSADASIFAHFDVEIAQVWKVLICEISSINGCRQVYFKKKTYPIELWQVFGLWRLFFPLCGEVYIFIIVIGDQRNSVYARSLKVWERKGRMGKAKHSS